MEKSLNYWLPEWLSHLYTTSSFLLFSCATVFERLFMLLWGNIYLHDVFYLKKGQGDQVDARDTGILREIKLDRRCPFWFNYGCFGEQYKSLLPLEQWT